MVKILHIAKCRFIRAQAAFLPRPLAEKLKRCSYIVFSRKLFPHQKVVMVDSEFEELSWFVHPDFMMPVRSRAFFMNKNRRAKLRLFRHYDFISYIHFGNSFFARFRGKDVEICSAGDVLRVVEDFENKVVFCIYRANEICMDNCGNVVAMFDVTGKRKKSEHHFYIALEFVRTFDILDVLKSNKNLRSKLTAMLVK
jgi:hypothetical protein